MNRRTGLAMYRMMIAVILGWLAWAPAYAEASCAMDVPLAAVAKAQAQLQARKVADLDSTVPPAVRADIHRLKDALVGLADARLACGSDTAAEPAQIQASLAAAVSSLPSANNHASPYGSDIDVSVHRPAGVSQWLVVQFGFSIECGGDNLLVVYERRDGVWHPLMRWQSPDYQEISGAFGGQFISLALPGLTPKLVVFHGTPWCSSRWSVFDLQVLVPAAQVAEPKVLLHQRHGYVLFDVAPTLKLKSDGFEVRAEVGMRDEDVMTRTGIFRYRIDGDSIERVQPVALNGRDFVDEWLQVKWSEAKAWSDPSSLPALERSHAALTADFGSGEHAKSFSFGAVRACSDGKNTYQVQLDLEPMEADARIESKYFLIRSGANSFNMLSVLPKPRASCRGGDLIPPR